ncbi:MAG: beta-lactamase family protein [Candidatus Bathyarchaeota archaeon]|nr:beta-lactamase family protein [Candidatus Bathyarchaeota archaeon]MDH5595155.1 beta-lactamase family protein [Candidatus Bathyarchaeota archaeon]
MTKSSAISGFVKPGFEAVREAFAENFERRNELGAACCIYYRGEKVVDLWGGVRNEATGEPWEEDTMVIVFSATKGLSGLAMALANSRGLFDYDERISKYWPEFAQQGKDKITIRQLLAHQAGLFAFDELGDKSTLADLDRLAVVLARQKPAYEPGTQQVYHALTLGYYESELLRRVDPKGRSIGQYFQDEIAAPLGLDFYIRLPEEIPNTRLATLRQAKIGMSAIFTMPIPLLLAAMNPRSAIRRALLGSLLPLDKERVYARNFEVPSGGGVGTARAIAHAYSVFATGGKELGLREETLRQLMAPPVAPLKGFRDGALKVEIPFSLGFTKPSPENPFGSPSSFGAPGSGGSFGFADPQAEIGYGYVLNGMGTSMTDPRELALRTAMYRSIGEPDPYCEGTQLKNGR